MSAVFCLTALGRHGKIRALRLLGAGAEELESGKEHDGFQDHDDPEQHRHLGKEATLFSSRCVLLITRRRRRCGRWGRCGFGFFFCFLGHRDRLSGPVR